MEEFGINGLSPLKRVAENTARRAFSKVIDGANDKTVQKAHCFDSPPLLEPQR